MGVGVSVGVGVKAPFGRGARGARGRRVLPSSQMPSPLSHLPFGSGLCSIFFVIFMGYAGSSSGFIPRGANKGIGPMVGKICLPLLIFRNIAKLDLSSAPFAVVGCIGVRTVTTTSKEKGRPNKTELPTTS